MHNRRLFAQSGGCTWLPPAVAAFARSAAQSTAATTAPLDDKLAAAHRNCAPIWRVEARKVNQFTGRQSYRSIGRLADEKRTDLEQTNKPYLYLVSSSSVCQHSNNNNNHNSRPPTKTTCTFFSTLRDALDQLEDASQKIVSSLLRRSSIFCPVCL